MSTDDKPTSAYRSEAGSLARAPVRDGDEAAAGGSLAPFKVIGAVALAGLGGLGLYWGGAFGGGLGDSVNRPEDCRSGVIVSTNFGRWGVCTQSCDYARSCPSDFTCTEGHCVPEGKKAEGVACDAPWECRSQVCRGIGTPGYVRTEDSSGNATWGSGMCL
jgi:hypothetical protein